MNTGHASVTITNMANEVVRYLKYSQFSFFGSLVVCFMLEPTVIASNLGISYYGNHKLTIIPYLLGLLLTSYFIIKAARALPRMSRTFNALAEALIAIALLIVGVLLTPYSVTTLFDRAHVLASGILFVVELVLATWLIMMTYGDRVSLALLIIQIFGAIIATVSLVTSIELMLTGQVITQLAFGLLLIRAFGQLVERPQT